MDTRCVLHCISHQRRPHTYTEEVKRPLFRSPSNSLWQLNSTSVSAAEERARTNLYFSASNPRLVAEGSNKNFGRLFVEQSGFSVSFVWRLPVVVQTTACRPRYLTKSTKKSPYRKLFIPFPSYRRMGRTNVLSGFLRKLFLASKQGQKFDHASRRCRRSKLIFRFV